MEAFDVTLIWPFCNFSYTFRSHCVHCRISRLCALFVHFSCAFRTTFVHCSYTTGGRAPALRVGPGPRASGTPEPGSPWPCLAHVRNLDSQNVKLSDSNIFRFSESQIVRFAESQILRFSESQILRISDSQILRFLESKNLRFSDSQIH